MKNDRWKNLLVSGLVLSLVTLRAHAAGANISLAPAQVSQITLQEQRLHAMFNKIDEHGKKEDAQRAAAAFIEHISVTSPIASEKLAAGNMEDAELESRFSVFLKDRPELLGMTGDATGRSPRVRVAEFLKRDEFTAVTESERLALADTFISRLSERSGLASENLRVGKMSDDELGSRVSVFVADIKAEAATAADPSAVALDAFIDSFVRSNYGRAGERATAISYRGTTEENGQRREFVVFRKRPDKFRMHTVENGLVVAVLSYDGNEAWQQGLGRAPQPLPASAQVALKKIASFDPLLVDYRERGILVKRENKPDSATARLLIKEQDGTEMTSEIDPETLNELATRTKRPDGKMEEIRYSDHRKVGVLNISNIQEKWIDGSLISTTKIEQVRPESGILDSFFTKPAKQSLAYMDLMGALVIVNEQVKAKAQAAGGKP